LRSKFLKLEIVAMKRLILIFAAGMFAAGAVSAGTFGVGNIGSPYIMWNGVLLVPTDGARSNAPACATESARFAIDGSTAAGKVRAAALLTALTAGKRVVVWGTGACSVWGDTETVDFFQIIN